jgi:hypothetical protein
MGIWVYTLWQPSFKFENNFLSFFAFQQVTQNHICLDTNGGKKGTCQV